MKCFMEKKEGVLCRTEGEDSFLELPDGEYEVDIKKPRNIRFHRKFFSVLRIAFENQDKYDNIDHFRWEILLKAGYYHKHATLKGNIIYFPKSLSFDNMDEIEFTAFYDKFISILFSDFIIGTSEDQHNLLMVFSSFV